MGSRAASAPPFSNARRARSSPLTPCELVDRAAARGEIELAGSVLAERRERLDRDAEVARRDHPSATLHDSLDVCPAVVSVEVRAREPRDRASAVDVAADDRAPAVVVRGLD